MFKRLSLYATAANTENTFLSHIYDYYFLWLLNLLLVFIEPPHKYLLQIRVAESTSDRFMANEYKLCLWQLHKQQLWMEFYYNIQVSGISLASLHQNFT